jgi:predicted porin
VNDGLGRPVWGADLKNTGDSFGLGLRAKVTSKIDLSADATHTKVKDEMNLLAIDPTNSSTVTLLPDTNTKVTTVKLGARYALQRNASIRLTYIHDEYKTDDWTWAYWNYSPAEGGTTVLQDPNQKVDFVGVSYHYRF